MWRGIVGPKDVKTRQERPGIVDLIIVHPGHIGSDSASVKRKNLSETWVGLTYIESEQFVWRVSTRHHIRYIYLATPWFFLSHLHGDHQESHKAPTYAHTNPYQLQIFSLYYKLINGNIYIYMYAPLPYIHSYIYMMHTLNSITQKMKEIEGIRLMHTHPRT